MKKQKSTKRALLMSALSLLLCMSMLVGTTFAWFTDEVTSAGNIIKSGTLDVEMYWKDATATGKQTTWKDASEGAIFNYDKWEPGYVEAKNIKIGNAGTLALKYQLTIVATGEVSKLSDVIDVYYAEGEYTLADREMSDLTYIGTLTTVLANMSATANGDLLEGETDTVTIALKMQETANNDYQGLSIGSEFAVKCFATQDTVEKDSFDEKYDKMATVDDADELKAALAAGQNVVLGANIDLTGVEWTPVGTATAPYSGIFDGAGHTISGLKITSGDYAGFFGYVSGATIKNVTLSDVSVSGSERMGALVGQIKGDAVVENCTVSGSVTGSDSNTGGLIGEIINGTVQLTNLTNNANVTNTKSSNSRAGGIVGQVTTGANVTLKNCVNNGDISTDNGYAGGIVSAYQSGTLTIENCVNNGELDGQYEGNMLGWYTSVQSITISSESNEFDLNAIGCVDIAITSNMSLYGKNYFVNKKDSLTGVTDTKQTFSEIFAADKIGTSPKALWDKLIAFYAHAAERNPNFAGYPDTYWKMFNKSVGYSEPDWNSYFESYNDQCGDGNELAKSEFSSASWRENIVYLAPYIVVNTADELKSAIANGDNIVLAADLDLSDWTSAEFSATLDGNGHTISNLTVGLFSTLRGATIKNLSIKNAAVTGGTSTGIVAARAYSGTVIENVTVDGTLTATGFYAGGLVGASMSKSNSFISCVNNADVTGGQHVGGIVGHGAYGVNIIGCTNNGNITGTGSFGPFAGGIVGFMTGWMNYSDGLVITVEDCVNNGTITSTTVTNAPKIGSIAGALGREGGDTAVSPLVAHINNCTDAANTGLALCGGLLRYNNGKDDGLYLFIDGVCDKASTVSNADELKNALANGGYVILGADIKMTSVISNPQNDFVLDGNGYTITMSDDCVNTYALFDSIGSGRTVEFKNVTFDGIKGGAIVRSIGADVIMDNVTVQNCNHTQQQGLLRLLGNSTITNSTFANNNCTMVISQGYDTDDDVHAMKVQNCVFEENTCNAIAVLYYAHGNQATIDGNKFVNNEVTSTDNAATLYMGFTENNVITNNVFDGNNVTTTSATSKRATGGLMIGCEATITGNAFVNNTITAEGRQLGNDVCASAYDNDIDLSGNYWGGSAPVENDDYYNEYPDKYSVIINDYLTTYGN